MRKECASMKDLLEGLSSEQEKELEALIKKILLKFHPEQIYCFGYRIDSLATDSCFSNSTMRSVVDYNLLVVTQSTVIDEFEIQAFASESFKSGTVTIINFSQKVVLASLAVGQNFINTIIKHGHLLFTKDDEPYKKQKITERAIDLKRTRFCFEQSIKIA